MHVQMNANIHRRLLIHREICGELLYDVGDPTVQGANGIRAWHPLGGGGSL
jgi:hypothetical protein